MTTHTLTFTYLYIDICYIHICSHRHDCTYMHMHYCTNVYTGEELIVLQEHKQPVFVLLLRSKYIYFKMSKPVS